MKTVALFFMLCLSAGAATYYVDATAGDNGNAGTSTGAPWKTLAYADAQTYSVGDIIALKRGEVWNEYFQFPTNGMTLRDYGSGELPLIDVGIAFNEAVRTGTASNTLIQFVHLKGGTNVSATYESSYGTNTLEDCVVETHPDACISGGGDTHIIARRCTIKGGGDDGFTLHVTASAEIYSCIFTNNRTAINNSGTDMQMTVQDCIFVDNGDGSAYGDLSMATTTSTFTRCWFKGRPLGGGSWKFFEDDVGANTTLDYCIFDGSDAASISGPSLAVNDQLVMRNCTLYGGDGGYGTISVAATGTLSATNCVFLNWWRAAYVYSGGVWNTDHCTYHTSGTDAWGSHTSNTIEIAGDPLLVDPAGENFALQSGSPCRNAGADVGLTSDYLGNAIAGFPDVGAFEYQSPASGTAATVGTVNVGTLIITP